MTALAWVWRLLLFPSCQMKQSHRNSRSFFAEQEKTCLFHGIHFLMGRRGQDRKDNDRKKKEIIRTTQGIIIIMPTTLKKRAWIKRKEKVYRHEKRDRKEKTVSCVLSSCETSLSRFWDNPSAPSTSHSFAGFIRLHDFLSVVCLLTSVNCVYCFSWLQSLFQDCLLVYWSDERGRSQLQASKQVNQDFIFCSNLSSFLSMFGLLKKNKAWV